MRVSVGAAVLLLVLAGCGGGGGRSSSTTNSPPNATTPTTGVDQATSPFCITMTQLVHMQNPVEFHAEVALILADAVKQAPATIQASVRVLAGVIQAAADTTSVPTPPNLASATATVGTYLAAHCGITLPGTVG